MKLWSHCAAQQLVEQPSEEGAIAREILSSRYGANFTFVLPLKAAPSQFAILDWQRQLLAVVEEAELPEAIRQHSQEEDEKWRGRRKAEQRQRRPGGSVGKIEGSLEDLGL